MIQIRFCFPSYIFLLFLSHQCESSPFPGLLWTDLWTNEPTGLGGCLVWICHSLLDCEYFIIPLVPSIIPENLETNPHNWKLAGNSWHQNKDGRFPWGMGGVSLLSWERMLSKTRLPGTHLPLRDWRASFPGIDFLLSSNLQLRSPRLIFTTTRSQGLSSHYPDGSCPTPIHWAPSKGQPAPGPHFPLPFVPDTHAARGQSSGSLPWLWVKTTNYTSAFPPDNHISVHKSTAWCILSSCNNTILKRCVIKAQM